MKIALVGQKGIPCTQGGIERYAEELAISLVRLGHEVIVYTRPHYTPKDLTSYKGVRLVSLSSIRTKHLDAISHSVLSSLHAIFFARADIIHYMNVGPALSCWIPKLFSRTTKVVSTFQSMDWTHEKWGAFARFSLRLGGAMMIRFSDVTFAVSREIQDYIKVRHRRVVPIISNGVTIKDRLTESVIDHELAQYKLARGGYILSASRLIRHKGIHYLIEAFQALPPNGIKLVIAGDGFHTDTYVDYLRRMAAGHNRIIFTGQVDGAALQALFEGAKAFVLPSEAEGLSLVLLEAMGYGLPTLASDIAPNKESARRTDGTYVATLFKNRDVKDLQAKLDKIISLSKSEREAQVTAARGHVTDHFNWTSIAEEVGQLYSSVQTRA